MTTQLHPSAPELPPEQEPWPPVRRWPWSRIALWSALTLVAILAVALGVVVSNDGDETATTTVPATTPTSAPSTTEAPTTTVTSTVTTVIDTSTAIWPWASSATRYAEPVEAATVFATEYLGFTNPVAGEFMAGDSRSGEVQIRPDSSGPVTTVFVRQLTGDDSWWILGATTDNIRLDNPSALSTISSPVELRGTSTAFEANVSVAIYADGRQMPLVEGWVMGGANGEFGPFAGSFEFTPPSVNSGAIVLYTRSMKDGSIWEASAVRVHFH